MIIVVSDGLLSNGFSKMQFISFLGLMCVEHSSNI